MTKVRRAQPNLIDFVFNKGLEWTCRKSVAISRTGRVLSDVLESGGQFPAWRPCSRKSTLSRRSEWARGQQVRGARSPGARDAPCGGSDIVQLSIFGNRSPCIGARARPPAATDRPTPANRRSCAGAFDDGGAGCVTRRSHAARQADGYMAVLGRCRHGRPALSLPATPTRSSPASAATRAIISARASMGRASALAGHGSFVPLNTAPFTAR